MINVLSPVVAAASDGEAVATGLLGIFGAIYAIFVGAIFLFYCLIIIFALVSFVFWIWMLIDALSRKNYDTENERLLWCLVVFLGHWIGAVIYYFIVKKKKEVVLPAEESTPTKPAKEAKK